MISTPSSGSPLARRTPGGDTGEGDHGQALLAEVVEHPVLALGEFVGNLLQGVVGAPVVEEADDMA